MGVLSRFFAPSPFVKLHEHARKVHECVELLRPLADALLTEDYEKIEDLHETLAKSFASVDQDYFAAKVYYNAAHYFELAGIEWKSIANYREAGIRYQKEAENMDVSLYHYAIRNILKKSIKAFVSANETKKAKVVKEKGQTILKDYENHLKYFEKLTLKGDN